MIALTTTRSPLNYWAYSCIAVSLFFLVDLILNVIAHSLSYIYRKRKLLILEVFLQIMGVVARCRQFVETLLHYIRRVTHRRVMLRRRLERIAEA